jgi:hypothetical protein
MKKFILVACIAAVASFVYLWYSHDLLFGTLAFGISAICIRVGLSTLQRRQKLEAAAMSELNQIQNIGVRSNKEEYIKEYIRTHETTETKKTIMVLAIAIVVVSILVWFNTR